jgi:3-methyladenine DNA glycosylase AlkC
VPVGQDETMPPFKDELGPAAGTRLARELEAAWPAFPTRRFVRGLAAALEPLELLARADHLATRLAGALPTDFSEAAGVLWRALDAPTFDGWMVLPCGTYVAAAGIDEPGVALPLLAGLTPRWTSEAPIRPFIERHPETTYEHLRRWCTDDDEHVRRLVSEGTRPRLPWARVLRSLVDDPSPNVPLVDALVDDPSTYVRRSVGNHLNDISRDHPDLALDLARRWLPRGDGAAWAVRHGLRTLVKRGDPDALALLGVDTWAPIRLMDLTVDPASLPIGGTCTFTCTLVLDGDVPVDAIIDYRIHYVGARATSKAPKVFKLTRRRLEPGIPTALTRAHSFDHVSIRRIHPGSHTIDVQVNGRVLGSIPVDVQVPDSQPT